MSHLTLLKNVLISLIGLIIFTCGWYTGSSYTEGKWQQKTLTEQNAHLNRAVAQATQSDTVVTKYVDNKTKIKDNTTVIIKKVPVYVTKSDDDACTIPDSFRLHWNAANRGVLPDDTASEAIDATTNPVRLSDVAAQHAREAETCKQTEAQLIALQEWVTSTVLDKKPP